MDLNPQPLASQADGELRSLSVTPSDDEICLKILKIKTHFSLALLRFYLRYFAFDFRVFRLYLRYFSFDCRVNSPLLAL